MSLVRVWTTETCSCACQIDLMHIPIREKLCAIFAPNSALIVLIHKDDARIYSAQTGEEMKRIRAPSINSKAYAKCSKFSRDSAFLALVQNMGFSDGAYIHLWCSKTWTMTHWIILDTWITDIDLSPDASLFVVVTGVGKVLIVGSTGTGQQLFNIASDRFTYEVSISPDWVNSSCLASTHDAEVRIWRAGARDTSAGSQNIAHRLSSVIISPGSKYVAAQSLDGCIYIWSGDSGESVQVLKGGDYSKGWPLFSPDSELIVCEDEGRTDVRIWRVDTGKPIHKLQGPNQPRGDLQRLHKVFSDDSKYLFIAYENWGVKVWCVDSGKCLCERGGSIFGRPFDTPLAALAISRDSKYFAVAGGGQKWAVRIWDWRAGHCVSTFSRPSEEFIVRGYLGNKFSLENVAFSSDATALAVIHGLGPDEYEVQIWEVATGIRLARVATGESYSLPLFDPVTNQILNREPRQVSTVAQPLLHSIPCPHAYKIQNGSFQLPPLAPFPTLFLCLKFIHKADHAAIAIKGQRPAPAKHSPPKSTPQTCQSAHTRTS